MASPISEAIEDLKLSIQEDGFDPEMIADTALAFDLNPVLLSRKFKEATGQEPENFSSMNIARVVRAKAIRKANEIANTHFSKLKFVVAGKAFEREGREYITIAAVGARIYCIRADSGKSTFLKFQNQVACRAYIIKKGLN